jgi:hypothetical protein
MVFQGGYQVSICQAVDLGIEDHGGNSLRVVIVKVVHEVNHGFHDGVVDFFQGDYSRISFLGRVSRIVQALPRALRKGHAFQLPVHILEKNAECEERMSWCALNSFSPHRITTSENVAALQYLFVLVGGAMRMLRFTYNFKDSLKDSVGSSAMDGDDVLDRRCGILRVWRIWHKAQQDILALGPVAEAFKDPEKSYHEQSVRIQSLDMN